MNLARLAIKRPTFIISVLAAILILGVVSFTKLSVGMFPDVEFPYVLVATTYSGAGVEEIEQVVTQPIENAVSSISSLKHVDSINQDDISIVLCEFELSKDPNLAAQEVRDKISQIKQSLPSGVKEPVVMKADVNSLPIVTLSLKSDKMPQKELYDFAKNVVSKDLEQISGVSKIDIVGGQEREIHIVVDKDKLKARELTLTGLAAKINANALNIPAGKINKNSKEITFRTIGEFKSVEQIKYVVVNFLGNDKPVLVGDIAKVEDSVVDEVSRARLDVREDGKVTYTPSLMLSVYRQAKSNDVTVADALKKKVSEVNEKYKKYEGSPHLTVISDTSHAVRMNLGNVKTTILEGILLAIIVVYFFLGSWRSTFITVLAIPNSLIGAFVFMYIAKFSLNVLSLMSLSLTVGLLIDDAIVVRENIFRHYERGSNPLKAAIDGTNEVTLAVIATTSTVIAVFLPLAFLNGIMGQFFKEFGLTIVFAMVISIIDALTIAPMLSAYIIPEHAQKTEILKSKTKEMQEKIIRIFRALTVDWFNVVFNWIEKLYRELITYIIEKNITIPFKTLSKKHKGFVMSWKLATLFIMAFIFVVALFTAKKYLKVTFMPSPEWGEFNIAITAKPGISLEQMDEYSKQIEEIIMSEPNVEVVSSAIGSADMFTVLSNQTIMYVKMNPGSSGNGFLGLFKSSYKQKNKTTSEMKEYLRKIFKEKFGDELEFSIAGRSVTGGGDREIIIELTGDNIEVLYDAAKCLMEKYKSIPYFVDIQSNYKPGKPEVQIQMDPKKMESFGVSSVMAGHELRAMVDGVLAGKYRENGLEYDIRVRFEDSQKDIAKNFDSIYVNNVNNKLVKLKNVASVKSASGPSQIYRRDRSRYVSIEGNIGLGGAIGDVQKKTKDIFNEEKANPKNCDRWKNIKYKASGDAENMGEMLEGIFIAGILSIVFIFMTLASLYESIITPFTIMTALPLAIIGGIIALLLSNRPIDMFTMIGMIMLLGIVAKNSILFVDCIQQQMHMGLSIDDSIIKAGGIRLRPILMTSFALIAGMLPTALGISEVGKFRKGMGIVVIGGIISSTILTLIVVPAIFEYMDKFRRFLRKIMCRPENRMIDFTEKQLKEKDL